MTASSSSKSTSRGTRIAAIMFLGLLGILIFAQGSSNPPNELTSAVAQPNQVVENEPESPGSGEPFLTRAPADVSALLDGLSLGNEIEGWKVVSFNVMKEKIVWIEFGNNGIYFSVGITAKGNSQTPPPIQTESYDIGYGMIRPRGTNIVPDVFTKLTEQIASRVRRREKEVAKPTVL